MLWESWNSPGNILEKISIGFEEDIDEITYHLRMPLTPRPSKSPPLSFSLHKLGHGIIVVIVLSQGLDEESDAAQFP